MVQTNSPNAYSDEFYDSIELETLESARIVTAVLLSLIRPNSVIDVGCGRGAWPRAFQENGVAIVRGLDGPYVNLSRLLIDAACFTTVDLGEPFEIDGRYDLAVCLEVAEHIRARSARSLVNTLTAAAPLVLFSAAVPGQGGVEHVNEQWPLYWRSLFAEAGFQRLDPIRRQIWQEGRVLWWYRQNLFLFASADAISRSPALRAEHDIATCADFELVHASILYRTPGLRELMKQLLPTARRALQQRLNSPLSRGRTKGARERGRSAEDVNPSRHG